MQPSSTYFTHSGRVRTHFAEVFGFGSSGTVKSPSLEYKIQAGMVAHPVTQVIGEQALVDILDLSEVTWTCWGVSTPSSGLGLRMVKN